MAGGFGFWFGEEILNDVFDLQVVGCLVLREGALLVFFA